MERTVEEGLSPELRRYIDQRIVQASRKLYEHFTEEIRRVKEGMPKPRMAIIASKGTLDMAYPPLLLATTARSMGLESGIFFTFYGLDIIHKKKNRSLKVASVGNPAMPVPVPTLLGALPGMSAMATAMMKRWMDQQQVPTISQLLELAQESGVKLVACQMTMDVMGIKEDELISGLEFGGVATFVDYALASSITLFI